MQKILTIIRYIENGDEILIEEGWKVVNTSSTFVPALKDQMGRVNSEKMFVVIVLEKI